MCYIFIQYTKCRSNIMSYMLQTIAFIINTYVFYITNIYNPNSYSF